MKFINKLFTGDHASWKDWVLQSAASFDTPTNGSSSFLWRIINDELNTHRSITYVRVNNGSTTSFWFNHWMPDGPLFDTHPVLFSHTTMPNVSVQNVFQNGFDLRLRPRLTNTASHELDSLLASLQDINLGEGPDTRLLKLTGQPYTARDAYAALDSADIHGRRIWGTKLPNKVKVFAWLYFKNWLSTRVNLHAKHVVDGDRCERCSRSVEDKHHVFFGCSESSAAWARVGMAHVGQMSDDEAWAASVPPGLNNLFWPFVFLAILWRIWECRNGHVFRDEIFCHRVVLSKVCDDIILWRKRLPPEHVNSLLGWHHYLRGCITNSVPRSGQLDRALLE